MERVVKRFLMHNQGDSDDPKQNEFDDLKQDLQMMRYEMLNDLKKSREDNMRNMFVINGGIQFLAEEILTNSINKENLNSAIVRYKELLSHHHQHLHSSTSASSESEAEKFTLGSATAFKQFRRQSSELVDKISNSGALLDESLKASKTADLEFPTPESSVKSATLKQQQQQTVASAEELQTPPGSFMKWQSTDDFFQTRLAYDFQTIHEEE